MSADGFVQNQYNDLDYIKKVISNSMIVSYGFITTIDFDTVVVTLSVSNSGSAERARCTFMNFGHELFALVLKPAVGMRVLVLAPNKTAEGMYESYGQLSLNEGRDYILTSTPAVYSPHNTICIPVMKSNSQALNTLIVDSSSLTAEIKHELLATLHSSVEIDLKGDSNIEYHENTRHFRGCYGSIEQTFGVLQGVEGVEKDGVYSFVDTYGKYSSVLRNYESGLVTVVGKAYEKPFLEDKGELLDSSAPVTISLGNKAPLFFATGSPVDIIAAADSPIAIGTESPVTLIFGEDVMTITLDAENGLDIALTGNTKVNIVAETGKFNFKNDNGSLKDVLDKIADLLNNFTTIGGNVVPGVPYTASASPAVIALVVELKAFTAGLLE